MIQLIVNSLVASLSLIVSLVYFSLTSVRLSSLSQLYEYAITVDQEVRHFLSTCWQANELQQKQYIWETKFSLVKVLFLLNRYLSAFAAAWAIYRTQFFFMLFGNRSDCSWCVDKFAVEHFVSQSSVCIDLCFGQYIGTVMLTSLYYINDSRAYPRFISCQVGNRVLPKSYADSNLISEPYLHRRS